MKYRHAEKYYTHYIEYEKSFVQKLEFCVSYVMFLRINFFLCSFICFCFYNISLSGLYFKKHWSLLSRVINYVADKANQQENVSVEEHKLNIHVIVLAFLS
jgi:hypothetical protein